MWSFLLTFLGCSGGKNFTKLSGNNPIFPFSSPLDHPSFTSFSTIVTTSPTCNVSSSFCSPSYSNSTTPRSFPLEAASESEMVFVDETLHKPGLEITDNHRSMIGKKFRDGFTGVHPLALARGGAGGVLFFMIKIKLLETQ